MERRLGRDMEIEMEEVGGSYVWLPHPHPHPTPVWASPGPKITSEQFWCGSESNCTKRTAVTGKTWDSR